MPLPFTSGNRVPDLYFPYLSLYINPTDFRQQDIVVNLNSSFIILINKLLLRLISQIDSCYFGSVVAQVFAYNLPSFLWALF